MSTDVTTAGVKGQGAKILAKAFVSIAYALYASLKGNIKQNGSIPTQQSGL